MDKETLIRTLKLEPHPEGGFYYQSYASKQILGKNHLYTSIYFLIEEGNISHFHRIPSDEMWYFHAGDAITIHMIHEDGRYESIRLGLDVLAGEVPQFLVPGNTIFASTVERGFSFVGCMVAPGFTFETFELFTQSQLLQLYPQHAPIIERYALESLE